MWEVVHGHPLSEEPDPGVALVGALYPTLEEIGHGSTYVTFEASLTASAC